MSHHLEVDQRDNDGLMVYPQQEEKIPNGGAAISLPPVGIWDQRQQHPPDAGSIKRLQRIIWLLMAAAILFLMLAIVAAAVGGSLASKRQNNIHDLQAQLDALKSSSSEATPLPSSLNTTTCPPTSNSTNGLNTTSTISAFVPSSNCSRLDSPYKNTVWFDRVIVPAQFSLNCGLDWPKSTKDPFEKDILGVYVYSFEECMNGCVRYNHERQENDNETCYGVSYVVEPRYGSDFETGTSNSGNCFLKSYQGTTFVQRPGTDSAALTASQDD